MGPRRSFKARYYLCLFIFAFCLWPCGRKAVRGQPPDAMYYVSQDGDDANPGTPERPWRHIEWAMTRPTLRGGDTVRIRQGVYRPIAELNPRRDSTTDDTLIRPVASGEPGRPITVMAEPGETVVLSGRFLAAAWEPARGIPGVYFYDYATPLIFPFDHPFQVTEDGRLLYRVAALESVDRPGRCFVDTNIRRIYVSTTDGLPPSSHLMEYGGSTTGIDFQGGVRCWRLAGFRLVGFKTTGVLVRNGAGSIELDHMDISYIGAHRPGADLSSGHAIATYDTTGGNFIHNGDLHHTLAETVHISQSGGGDLYENNAIHDAGSAEWFFEGHAGRLPTGPGMILRGDRITIRGNRIYNNGYHGLTLESDLRGSEGPAAPTENIIEGNTFAFNAGNGLYGDGKNGVASSRGNLIRFNLFDRNNQARAGSGGDGELRLAGNLDDALVYNNTFYTDKANCILLYSGREAAGTSQGADAVPDRLRILNNIALQAARSPSLYALRAIDVGPGFVSDYNNWFRPAGGPLVGWNGADFFQLEQFRAASDQERRGMSLDPRFVSIENANFWLRALSPMIGRGLADIRAAGGVAPDLGAFPYRPLITLSRTELRLVVAAGRREPAPQMIEIRSASEKPIAWTARTGDEGWLRISAPAGDTPAALAVSVRPAGLAAGAYSGMVQVTPALEGEPPISVKISLTAAPNPPRRR